MDFRERSAARNWLNEKKKCFTRINSKETNYKKLILATERYTTTNLLMPLERIEMINLVAKYHDRFYLKSFLCNKIDDFENICELVIENMDELKFNISNWYPVLFEVTSEWLRLQNDEQVHEDLIKLVSETVLEKKEVRDIASTLFAQFLKLKEWLMDKEAIKKLADAALALYCLFSYTRYNRCCFTWEPYWIRNDHTFAGRSIAWAPRYSMGDLDIHAYFLSIALQKHKCKYYYTVTHPYIHNDTTNSKLRLWENNKLKAHHKVFTSICLLVKIVDQYIETVEKNNEISHMYRTKQKESSAYKRLRKNANTSIVNLKDIYKDLCTWCKDNSVYYQRVCDYFEKKNFSCVFFFYVIQRFLINFHIDIDWNCKGVFYGHFIVCKKIVDNNLLEESPLKK